MIFILTLIFLILVSFFFLFSLQRLEPITVDGEKLYFRGLPILTAVIENLLDIGMKDADAVILSGCSGKTIIIPRLRVA